MTGGGYARMVISAGQWGDVSATPQGFLLTGAVLIFPTATTQWATANGLFLASNSASHAVDTAIYFSNFAGARGIGVASGDVLMLTPKIRFRTG